jgi:hypothetical protein
MRLVAVREENAHRQAQLEERIIAPENDEFAPSKGKGSRTASTKRVRAATSKRYHSTLTAGDLDGKYRQDDEDGQEDLSAVYVATSPCNNFLVLNVIAPCSVKSFRKNKNWRPPPQPRAPNRAAVEFSSP